MVIDAQPLPFGSSDLEPKWLSGALREAGVITQSSEIDELIWDPLGEGEGFVGDLGRLTLRYRHGSGPTTMVAKLPTEVAQNRAMGRALGVYQREVMVYHDLLPSLGLPCPRLYVGRYDADGSEEAELRRIVGANHLPMPLLRLLTQREQRNADVPPTVLLLEDLQGQELGDQVAGCSVERAAKVLEVAADLHGRTWGAKCPQPTVWLQPGDVAPRVFHAVYLNHRRMFEERASRIFSEQNRPLLRSVRRGGARRIRLLHRQAPRCLLHGDFRLDNMFFGADGSVSALFDWQTTNLGPGVLDIAYFITGSLGFETPEEAIDELLHHYHRRLVDNGVDEYPFDQLAAEYNEALLVLLHRMSAIGGLDFGDGRGAELIERWLGRFDARLRRLTT